MAHKKAGGASRCGRDSKPKMLGVKKYAGEQVSAGTRHSKALPCTVAIPFSALAAPPTGPRAFLLFYPRT